MLNIKQVPSRLRFCEHCYHFVSFKLQEAVSATVKGAHHSFEAENSSGRGSPRSQVVKSQSLSASRSPRPSRSPIPASRYKDSFSASDEKTQFPAYLSAQLGMSNFDPSAGLLGFDKSLQTV